MTVEKKLLNIIKVLSKHKKLMYYWTNNQCTISVEYENKFIAVLRGYSNTNKIELLSTEDKSVFDIIINEMELV